MTIIDNADFGKTAADYLTHRAGFPKSLFENLQRWDIGIPGQAIVDLGTGTGTLARGFAAQGCNVTGIDPAAPMLAAAERLADEQGVTARWLTGSAEKTGLADKSADVVTCGQCWHWFEPAEACREIRRILKPGGQLLIASYDWLPLNGNVVLATEGLIESLNPAWKGGNGYGVSPRAFRDLGEGGFNSLESFSYDEPAIYSHEAWRGRIRASAGVSASLPVDEVKAFDAALAALLVADFPTEPLVTPHRVFALRGFLEVSSANA